MPSKVQCVSKHKVGQGTYFKTNLILDHILYKRWEESQIDSMSYSLASKKDCIEDMCVRRMLRLSSMDHTRKVSISFLLRIEDLPKEVL
jgi:hypothetical protein